MTAIRQEPYSIISGVPLVLASASPRRAELLAAAGIPFSVCPVDVDESPRAAGAAAPESAVSAGSSGSPPSPESPEAYVRRIARAKAEAAGPPDRGTVILTADTTVTIDGLILGKPGDDREAAAMIARLSGRTHRVLTAFVLSCGAPPPDVRPDAWVQDEEGAWIEEIAVTHVTFHPLSDEAIAWYVASGEPRGKAGGYGIQGLASRFVARLDGSYPNVVGLPVDLVCRHLERVAPGLLARAAVAPLRE